MSHDKWFELAEIYATGALDGEDRSRFESHLNTGCTLCREHLKENEEALTLLPQSLSLVEPSPLLRARLLEKIAKEAPLAAGPVPGSKSLSWMIPVGVFAMVSLVFVLVLNVAKTRDQLNAFQKMASAPGMMRVELKGMDPNPNASAQILLSMEKKTGMMMTQGLQPTPEGKIYELWYIMDNKPVPAGTFAVDENGFSTMAVQIADDMAKIQKFAVTLEPVGGVPQPTGPMYLIGAL
jgi:anti-sigma-K factor RskA